MRSRGRAHYAALCAVAFLVGLAMVLSPGTGPVSAQAITEFTVPTPNSSPNGIVSGPDGALWFTELNANRIGRVTTAGAFTEFPLPTPNSAPFWIVVGPDGALWFTEIFGNRIGRITTAGAITAFTVPTANSGAA